MSVVERAGSLPSAGTPARDTTKIGDGVLIVGNNGAKSLPLPAGYVAVLNNGEESIEAIPVRDLLPVVTVSNGGTGIDAVATSAAGLFVVDGASEISTYAAYSGVPTGANNNVAAQYEGTPAGASSAVTITAAVAGTNGNSIEITFNGGSDTITDAIGRWNTANPDNEAVATTGNFSQTPSAGSINLSGGVDLPGTSVTVTAAESGTIGNSIVITFSGSETIQEAIDAWNSANPTNEAVATSGNFSQVPTGGSITLSGGSNTPAVTKNSYRTALSTGLYFAGGGVLYPNPRSILASAFDVNNNPVNPSWFRDLRYVSPPGNRTGLRAFEGNWTAAGPSATNQVVVYLNETTGPKIVAVPVAPCMAGTDPVLFALSVSYFSGGATVTGTAFIGENWPSSTTVTGGTFAVFSTI